MDRVTQVSIDTMFESDYQAMVNVIRQTTRIPLAIIDMYGRQYQFKVSLHFFHMISRLRDGSVDPEAKVKMLEFMLIPRCVKRAIK